MLHPIQVFFTSLSSWLIIFKYLGLSLAAVSSVWATLNELTVTTPRGRKKLTTAGVGSIALTMIGLVISIFSEDLQRREAARSQAEQVAAEAKRTNDIIIAGQPLTSLSLVWTFNGLDAARVSELKKGSEDALAFIEDQQGERDAQQNGAVFRENMLYPFLASLSRTFTKDKEKDTNANVAVLIALDDDQNAVLPFGFFADDKPWHGRTSKDETQHVASPSLEIGSHSDVGNEDLKNWPALNVMDDDVTITWKLDPSTFAKSINRQNQFIVPTAKAPRKLLIAIVFDIKELPFTDRNFALAEDPDFWNFPDYPDTQNGNFRGKVAPTTKEFASSVQLVPNSSSIFAYTYTLNQTYETLFLDSYGEANSNLRCLVFEYELKD